VRGPADPLKLENAIRQATKISLSGGTDPANDAWLCNFVLHAATVSVDLHTSVFDKKPEFYDRFNKCVFHIRPKDLFNLPYFSLPRGLDCKVRINMVATYEVDYLNIKKLVESATKSGLEIGFRELHTNNPGLKCSEKTVNDIVNLSQTYSNLMYIKQADYNYYYMPDDNIYTTYLLKEN
jgi:hypothetical protein